MSTALPQSTDVIVVGGGNAAFCAALAAAEQGVSVLVLERAPEEEAGGNSRFTAGAFRCVYDGVEDLRALMPDLTDEEVAKSDFGTYTEEKFFDDMGRVTEYRTDPDLCEVLIKRSKATMLWMRDKGVRFMPIWGRQAYKIDGMFKFWGGLTVESVGGGPGLVEALTKIARKNNIDHRLRRARAVAHRRRRRREGRARQAQRQHHRSARANAWCSAPAASRPTPKCARAISAPAGSSPRSAAPASTPATASTWRSRSARMPTGNWSGGHAVAWDRNAPEFGDLDGRRQFPEALLSVGHHDQCQRRALPRRGLRLPQLHLCQERPHHPDAAQAVLLPGVRQQDHPDAARRISHQAGDQGARQHAGRAVRRRWRTSTPRRRSPPSRNTTRR